MKYFTQELIIRGQSDDDNVLNEVDALWDEQCDRYFAYLESIKEAMPPGVRKRVESYYLHDALIRGMGIEGDSFVIMVRLDTPPQSLVTFRYDLVSAPEIQKDTLPWGRSVPGTQVDWQYDEIEMIPGTPPTWAQSILLSNGWEVRLHFRDVQVQEVQALIPSPGNGQLTMLDSAMSGSAG